MKAPVKYIPPSDDAEELATTLWLLRMVVTWGEHGAPRKEAFFNRKGTPYTYGRGAGERTYYPSPYEPGIVTALWERVWLDTWIDFEALFMNLYEDERKHLGWHADDSPSIDANKPIVIMSFGAEREIWFRENGSTEVERLLLENGSTAIMAPGMQQTHQHRIPKHSAKCGPRVSLTFRGLV